MPRNRRRDQEHPRLKHRGGEHLSLSDVKHGHELGRGGGGKSRKSLQQSRKGGLDFPAVDRHADRGGLPAQTPRSRSGRRMPLCRPTLPFSSPGKGRLARALYKEEMIRLKQWLASRPFRHNGKVKGPKSVEEGGEGSIWGPNRDGYDLMAFQDYSSDSISLPRSETSRQELARTMGSIDSLR